MRAALAASLLLTAALPAAAQAPGPAASPWSVESPGPLGARFGLGVDLLLDRFDDLEAAAGRQTVTVRGPDGGEETTVVPFDPRLDNRKHGRDWEERSVGVQVPIALPRLPLGRGLSIEPSLVLEAAAVDGRFTVADLVEGRPERHLDGSGARWGVGVEALGELCRGCRWFWSAGYRYRSLGGLEVDGPAPADAAGLAATERTEIDHDAHHLTARLGALVAGGRATAYLGVRGRQSDLRLDDETTLRSPQTGSNDVLVATRLELEADDTAALAGTDFRLGGGFVGRVEATFGGESESVLVKVVRAHHRLGSRPTPPTEPPTEEEIAELRQRAVELADSIAPEVGELKRRFEREKNRLEREAGPDRPPPVADVLALLDDLERGLRETLDARELLPILAWFLDLLARARIDLTAAEGGGVDSRLSPGPPPRGLAFAALSARQDPRPVEPSGTPATSWLARILANLEFLELRADTRQLTQDLCVRSEPRPRAKVLLWPRAFAAPDALTDVDTFELRTEGRLHVFYRGSYAYRATHRGHPPIACPAEDAATRCASVDLWQNEGPFLTCDFDPDIGQCWLEAGDLARCGL